VVCCSSVSGSPVQQSSPKVCQLLQLAYCFACCYLHCHPAAQHFLADLPSELQATHAGSPQVEPVAELHLAGLAGEDHEGAACVVHSQAMPRQGELAHGGELGVHSAQADAKVEEPVDKGLEHLDPLAGADRMGDVDPPGAASSKLGSAVLQVGLGSMAHTQGGAAKVVVAKRDVVVGEACAYNGDVVGNLEAVHLQPGQALLGTGSAMPFLLLAWSPRHCHSASRPPH